MGLASRASRKIPTLRLRRATAGDLPAIVRLLADDPLGAQRERLEVPLPASYAEAFEAIDRDPNNELAVAESPLGDVIGVLQLTYTPYITHRGGWRATVEGVRVDERYRSAGIGRRMFLWAIERARARGCHLVQLTTDKRRPEAARFYESLGFVASHEGMKLKLDVPHRSIHQPRLMSRGPSVAELARVPILASLSEDELRATAPLFAVRSFTKNAVVATAGDRLDTFNLILSGSIEWFWQDDADRQLKLSPEGPGGHFADVTLDGEPIPMSVTALEDLRLATIPMTEFRALLLRHPKVAVATLMDVVARLRRVLKATRTLAMEDVYARVVKVLLADAVEVDGSPVANLTHAEIGHRVGATREMVGRLLRDLARGGYVKTERGRITILRKPPPRS